MHFSADFDYLEENSKCGSILQTYWPDLDYINQKADEIEHSLERYRLLLQDSLHPIGLEAC